ncbi:hypothetical protein B4098_0017 [Heyndrickxia coagulans]|uniref:Uncharacterized protein n=1 Tax=Heyndrickxia coagulans TaxID=1398 RepID=A0A150JQS5_HEYCO|nr:hypothetical protein B4098_0017 [Heyndrickxia coagulans]
MPEYTSSRMQRLTGHHDYGKQKRQRPAFVLKEMADGRN